MTYRKHVNKSHSARKFRKATAHTKRINIAPAPLRGGYRL